MTSQTTENLARLYFNLENPAPTNIYSNFSQDKGGRAKFDPYFDDE